MNNNQQNNEKQQTTQMEQLKKICSKNNNQKKTKKTIEESVQAIVVQAGSTYEKDNETGEKETVQDVKVKILQGTKENEKFNATYVLSYDLDNKIIGYKLREENLLFVNIAEEDGECNTRKKKLKIIKNHREVFGTFIVYKQKRAHLRALF